MERMARGVIWVGLILHLKGERGVSKGPFFLGGFYPLFRIIYLTEI